MSINTWIRIQCIFLQVLGEQMFDFPLPDVALVAEHADPLNVGRLLQLILGCAVKCERKQGRLTLTDPHVLIDFNIHFNKHGFELLMRKIQM